MPCRFAPHCDIDPPCPVQLSPTSTTLPQHICREMAWKSVDCFATGEPISPDIEMFTWTVEYPLPIGAEAIKEWHDYWEAANRQSRETLGVPLVIGEIPKDPLTTLEDALLGLAVPRVVFNEEKRVGHIWLLGLVERATEGRPQPGTPSYFDQFMEDPPRLYRYAAPIVKAEIFCQTQREEREVIRVAKQLRRWYGKHILGKLVGSGRTEGSVALPAFPERAYALYHQLAQELHRRPTVLDVALTFHISEATFYRYLERYQLSWPPE